MSKINVEFDTVEKTLTATVDGKAVANIAEVMIYKGYSDDEAYRCNLTTMIEDEEQGCMHMTRLCASESEVAKANVEMPGFLKEIVPVKTQVQLDIEKFFE